MLLYTFSRCSATFIRSCAGEEMLEIPKMTETIFENILFDVYFDFFSFVHVPSVNLERIGEDLASLFGGAVTSYIFMYTVYAPNSNIWFFIG